LGNYLLEVPDVNAGLLADPIVQDVLEVCEFWDMKLQGETADYSRRFRNKMHLKKGHLYYMIDDNLQALNQFGNIQAWGDSFALGESNYWMCQINQIEQLKASNNDALVLLNLPLCDYDSKSSLQFKRDGTPQQILKPEFENEFTVYPNPTKDFFVATFKVDEAVLMNVSLTDIYGKEIENYGEVSGFVGVNKAKLSTEGLRAGTYFVKFSAGNVLEYRRVVLLD
jgi:hypothetical protein